MKITRYRHKEKEHYGILNRQSIICLPDLAKHFKETIPETIEEFVISGEKEWQKAETLLRKCKENSIETVSPTLSEVVLLAPIASPPKIICLGLNYVDHAAETHKTIPNEPIIFIKPHTTIIGPNQNIIKPRIVHELDYEGELAIVIGKKAKNISLSEVMTCVFGYTILNDISARDYQFKDGQWTRGKSYDTFAPTGPSITTAAQLKDTTNLSVRTWVNGELRQNSTTNNMVFSVKQIVHHLSQVMTLEPCDIISTGTPAGVGFAMKPPHYLQHGDIVRIEIQDIGALENTVEEQ